MPGFQPHPYAFFLLISALISGIVGVFAMSRRESSGMRSLAGTAAILSFWAFAYGLAWASTSLPARHYWYYSMYFAVLVAPLGFLMLVLDITRQSNWLTSRRLLLLSIEPVFMLLALWTNHYHHLFISQFSSYSAGGLSYFDVQRGPLGWINVAYSYGLLLASMIVLVRAWLRVSPLFRRQIGVLLAAAGIPWLAHMLVLLGVLPLGGLDITPIAFGLTAAVFYYALYNDVRMDLLPMARSLLLHATSDGLLVLDSEMRIVDINPSAEQTIGIPAREIIGQNSLDLFPEWQDMLALLKANRQEIRSETQGLADLNRYYDVKATPIKDKGAITGYLVLFRDMTDRWHAEQELLQANYELKSRLQEIEDLQKELRLQATRDPLTNLYNRRYLEETLEKELARAERKNSPVAIIMLDADNFKHINDRFGHKSGDRALQALSRIIKLHIRTSDIACRYGGEEFVIVMPNTEVETARERADKIRKDFYRVDFNGPDSAGETSLSIGIAIFPRSGQRGDEVLDAADQAMYSAKKSGGNRIQLHPSLTLGPAPAQGKRPPGSARPLRKPRNE